MSQTCDLVMENHTILGEGSSDLWLPEFERDRSEGPI